MFKMFIIVSTIFSLTGGLLFGAMLTIDMDGRKRLITTVLIASIIGCVIGGALCLEHKGDVDNWNNGSCSCGNEWRFVNADYVKNSGTRYYYHCDDCNKTIELHSQNPS